MTQRRPLPQKLCLQSLRSDLAQSLDRTHTHNLKHAQYLLGSGTKNPSSSSQIQSSLLPTHNPNRFLLQQELCLVGLLSVIFRREVFAPKISAINASSCTD